MFKDKDSNYILVCACHNVEHQVVIQKFEHDRNKENKELYLGVHLKPGNFFQRLIRGIKYIFGHRSIYGDFDEFVFKPEHSEALIEAGNFLKLTEDVENADNVEEIPENETITEKGNENKAMQNNQGAMKFSE